VTGFLEYPIELRTGTSAQGIAGALRCLRSRCLVGIVDSIWDIDIPDGDAARTLTIKHAPSTSLVLLAQYRAPVQIRHRGHDLPAKCAIHIQAHAATLRPTGALGVLIVCLRPDAVSQVVDGSLGEFADTSIHMKNLFSAGDVSTCDEMLADAGSSRERMATVEAFLLRRLRPRSDSLAGHVAQSLRKNPALQVERLASRLGFSARHLARSFNAAFGMGPKHFSRLARFEKIMTARRDGLSWAQVACACGLSDQAHLVKEFKAIVGERPTEFFARELAFGTAGMRQPNFVVQRRMFTGS
jgi:AraC-like DNA-binding protein